MEKRARCWCNAVVYAEVATMDVKDRLNPGRAYYRCGNFGRGATCSFFAWIPAAPPAQPSAAIPINCPANNSGDKTIMPATNAKINTTPEPKRAEMQKDEAKDLDNHKGGKPLPNERRLAEEKLNLRTELDDDLVAMFGRKKRRSSSSSSKNVPHKTTPTTPTTPPKPSTPLPSDPDSSLIPTTPTSSPTSPVPPSSPYYSSTPPMSIPRRREPATTYDKLNELDRRLMLKHESATLRSNSGLTTPPRRPNTYPSSPRTIVNNKRSCYQDEEEDGFVFPYLPSFVSEPASPIFIVHQKIQVRFEGRG